MQWRGRRGSRNIEDRRRTSGRVSGRAAGGIGGAGLIAVLAIGYVLGVDVTPLLRQGDPGGAPAQITDADEAAAHFVSVTLADTEEIWAEIFARQLGERYEPVTLVLFKGATQSACGGASGATGPFYCPGDRKVYLDTAFFATLADRLGARGDFAAAYVVAHEVGHYVQDRLGILGQANRLRQQGSAAQSNAISVRIELQADCFAGLWAAQAADRFGTLEPGDIDEAMNAAARIGDDALQTGAGRVPRPESFTHGTSAQRQRWFMTGYRGGDLNACDTFGANRL